MRSKHALLIGLFALPRFGWVILRVKDGAEAGRDNQSIIGTCKGHLADHVRLEPRNLKGREAVVIVEVWYQVAHKVQLRLRILFLFYAARRKLVFLLFLSYI